MNTQEMISSEFNNVLIKDIVASNFRAAAIFEKHGIDFCCKGNRTIKTACDEKGLNDELITSELADLSKLKLTDENRYDEWELDFLIQHIINNHHNYIKKITPQLIMHTEKIADVHGKRHPELIEVKTLFNQISKELSEHLQKEESILFPMINTLVQFHKNSVKPENAPVSIKKAITVMESEHSNAGVILEQLRIITNNFELPGDACNTFRVTYQELEEFEKDLHKHVFLENSILFPKAILLEEM